MVVVKVVIKMMMMMIGTLLMSDIIIRASHVCPINFH